MKNMKKILSLVLVGAMVVSMAACGGKNDKADTTPTPTPAQSETNKPEATKAPEYVWDGAYMAEDDFKAFIKHDLETVVSNIDAELTDAQRKEIKAVADKGNAAIDAAHSVKAVQKEYETAVNTILSKVELASGLISYMKLSNAERTELLGLLERYAVETGITGTTLYESGTYRMYNPRITLGTENYIIGYGFGILPEGDITADLEYETNPAWKRYYHTYEADDPGTLNYLNDKGAQVGDLYAYFAGSYFTQFMNATKDGYEWVPELAMEKPVPVNDDDNDGICSKWRFQIRTEKEGLKYTTGSKIASRAAFNNRGVKLEDYITPYKLLLTQANELYRGSESVNQPSAIKGSKAYYEASKDGFNESAWKQVGIRAYEENGKSYLEYEFENEYNQFYSMYYINSNIFCPVPQEFIDLVTIKNYLGFNKDATEGPVDNALALGAYYLESYTSNQEIVFKKNPNYVYADTKYKIPGVYTKIYPAAKSDQNAVIKEFLIGHFDACVIPKDYMNQYRNDPRTRSSMGTSCYKLNMNATDAATWEKFFGENGVVTQTPKDSYWPLKPAMSNAHFRKALSYSIDRLTYANTRGYIPSVDYLSSNYMSDPENGISYSTTEAHKNAIKSLIDETDGYGYSLELAREYFRLALTELEANGQYTPGTKENPTVIDIEIAWMEASQEESNHNELKNFYETAFNDPSVSGGKYKLNIKFWVGALWSDVYYNKMMKGQFDIAYGSISGSALDPIGFVSVLSSDQTISGSFTLNWGVDTNDPYVYPLIYDGKLYSFDALYNATNLRAIIVDGRNEADVNIEYNEIVKNADGTYTGSFVLKPTMPELSKATVNSVVCCNYERYKNGDKEYDEKEITFETAEKDGTITVTFTVPADLAADYATGSGTSKEPKGLTGFDLYYDFEFNGNVTKDRVYSANDVFEVK